MGRLLCHKSLQGHQVPSIRTSVKWTFTHNTMHVHLDTVAHVGLGENNETQMCSTKLGGAGWGTGIAEVFITLPLEGPPSWSRRGAVWVDGAGREVCDRNVLLKYVVQKEDQQEKQRVQRNEEVRTATVTRHVLRQKPPWSDVGRSLKTILNWMSLESVLS